MRSLNFKSQNVAVTVPTSLFSSKDRGLNGDTRYPRELIGAVSIMLLVEIVGPSPVPLIHQPSVRTWAIPIHYPRRLFINYKESEQ